jgi:hypothetical protein
MRFVAVLLILFAFYFPVAAQKRAAGEEEKFSVTKSDGLQKLVDAAAADAIAKFGSKGFTAENFGITLIDIRDAANLKQADFRGEQMIYPASVVKLFYLAAAHRWLEDKKIRDTAELRRALKDMIVDSSNDATHQIVDVLTKATGGGELSPDKLKKWAQKRNAVNRYFAALGYQNINVNQKTYCEDLYGRERQFWNEGRNRNKLTTNATARLLTQIALRRSVNADRSRQMMELLKRDPQRNSMQPGADPDSQDTGFIGMALKTDGIRLWSKAGWTSNSRHDVAYVETPGGLKFTLAIYTEKFANQLEIIPFITERLLVGMSAEK